MPYRAFLLLICCVSMALGASLAVTVKDPSGAVVSGAAVHVAGQGWSPSLDAVTDNQGRAKFEPVGAGSYRVSVSRDGFDKWERAVEVGDQSVDLAVSLKLSVLTTTVQVSGKRSSLANSDPNYTAIRRGKLEKVYQVENLVLARDVGTFTLRKGSFSFLPPVLGHVATGVFVGDGNFKLTPAFDVAVRHLHRMMGADSVDEDFTAMVVYFSDSTFDEIKLHSQLADESPERHEEALKRVKNVIESRRQPPSPMLRGARPFTLLERLLNYEDIPNYEAEVLAELYNPAQRGAFRAFLRGKKHGDLRFLLNPRGAMPMLNAPEEIALLNFDPDSESDGVWYLSHPIGELRAGKASSSEDKRLIAPEHYKMQVLVGKENLIGNLPDMAVTCELTFRALENGTRMVKFDLVPDLQMSRVGWNGKDIPFIQESRKQDGSFYLQTPEALRKGETYLVTFEYSGGEILQSQFGMVPPRRVWYPTPSGPASRATFDTIFRIPRGSSIVTSGIPVKQSRDGGYDLSEWVCDTPIQQAVFRYLEDSSLKMTMEESTNTQMAVYMVPTGRGFIGESSRDVLIDTANSLRIFNAWFGKQAYDRISVVMGNSTDSLPGLVYASPVITAGYGSLVAQSLTRSRGRSGGPPATVRTYLDEAFPREIARQWWGNTVSPMSFHDAWLSTGLANFSTSLYDLAAYLNPNEFRDHWVKARELLLQANRFGVRPNDAGPVWMGTLNDTFKTQGASFALSSAKGGYIIHMLRSMMWDSQNGDRDFQAMMHDFVKQFSSQAVTSEDFKWVLEKHMKRVMDLDGNHTMDWFFGEWLLGTEVPSYRLEYSLTPQKEGKTLLKAKLTQSGVSDSFRMPVPLYGEFASKKVRLGLMSIRGNSTSEFKVVLSETPKRILLNVNHDVLADKEEVKQLK